MADQVEEAEPNEAQTGKGAAQEFDRGECPRTGFEEEAVPGVGLGERLRKGIVHPCVPKGDQELPQHLLLPELIQTAQPTPRSGWGDFVKGWRARTVWEGPRNAERGIDPKAEDPSKSVGYAEAVEEFVKREQMGRRQNSNSTVKEARRLLLKLSQTSRGLKDPPKPHEWHARPVATIRPDEIQKLLELVRDGDAEKGFKPRPYLANSLVPAFVHVLRLVRQTDHRQGQVVPHDWHREAVEWCKASTT